MRHGASSRFRGRWYVAAALAAAAVGAVGAANPWQLKLPCEVASAWADGHVAEFRGIDLATLSRYPMLYRKAIYQRLTSAERVKLWREQLASFLGPRSALTPPQQATVTFIMNRLNRYVGTAAMGRAAAARDGITRARLSAEFGDSLAGALFATLGPAQVTGDIVAATGPSEVRSSKGSLQRTAAPRATLASMQFQCDCATGSDYCSSGSHCRGGMCTEIFGCGFLWLSWCNGLCYYGHPT